MSPEKRIACLDVSSLAYDERVCAAAVQGLLNRSGANVFLDYGTYDDPMARRTNEVFMDDDFWYGKYRAMLGNQDQNNLDYYKKEHGFAVEQLKCLNDLIIQNLTTFKGYVVWDDTQPDTINLAVMLAGLDELIAVSPAQEDWVKQFNLPKAHDLRGKWQNRVDIYTWAFENLFPRCKKGMLACLEPAWERPEFLDYAVQNSIFIYSLSSTFKGFGST
ncbi:MAG: GxGYxYP family putative glycoside hydrolase, partial [Anaerolineaceae bacterium]|nr:GxGYxYP family putative glycoside hydrolase [Anaerolineaceae bacterium]